LIDSTQNPGSEILAVTREWSGGEQLGRNNVFDIHEIMVYTQSKQNRQLILLEKK
jgi:hypothetical protein